MAFTDSREVNAVIKLIAREYPDWELIPMTAEDFARDTRLITPLPPSFDDTVVATVYCGSYSNFRPIDVTSKVKPYMELVGKVHSVQELQFGTPSDGSRLTTHELKVKYFDCRHAANAVKALNAIRTGVCIALCLPIGLHFDETFDEIPLIPFFLVSFFWERFLILFLKKEPSLTLSLSCDLISHPTI